MQCHEIWLQIKILAFISLWGLSNKTQIFNSTYFYHIMWFTYPNWYNFQKSSTLFDTRLSLGYDLCSNLRIYNLEFAHLPLFVRSLIEVIPLSWTWIFISFPILYKTQINNQIKLDSFSNSQPLFLRFHLLITKECLFHLSNKINSFSSVLNLPSTCDFCFEMKIDKLIFLCVLWSLKFSNGWCGKLLFWICFFLFCKTSCFYTVSYKESYSVMLLFSDVILFTKLILLQKVKKEIFFNIFKFV